MDGKVSSFLKNIEQIESSGGTNTDHPEIESGIHSGHSAIGRYGLMPNTIKEIINRERLAGNNKPIYDLLEELDPVELKDFIEQSPEIETQLAKSLATRVLGKTGGDEEKAAFAWNMGHNLSPETIVERDYKSSPYVKKFQALNQLTPIENPESAIKLSSKVNAPLPSFANESGTLPTRSIFEKFGEKVIDKGTEVLDKGLENYDETLRIINEASDPLFISSGGKERSDIQIDPMGFMGSIKNVAKAGLTVETPFIKKLRDQWNRPSEVANDVIGEFGSLPESGTSPGIRAYPDPLSPSAAQLNQMKAVDNASERLLSPFQQEIVDKQSALRKQPAVMSAAELEKQATIANHKRVIDEMNNPEPSSSIRQFWQEQLKQGQTLPPSAEALLEGGSSKFSKRSPVLKPSTGPAEKFLPTMGLEKEPVASQNALMEALSKHFK